MIFKANHGFRNVSMAMTVLCCECKIERAPSHEICVQWALKVGFYKLSVLKKREDCQWIWIVDHAVKAGVDKCLIVLGIRLDQIKGRRDLTLSLDDVAPLGVISMRVSNGKTVNEEFEKLAAKTGIPKALVIDHGSDLRSGAQKFCRKHSGVLLFYDIVHKIALAISSRIKENSRWQAFTIAAARAKKELQLTEFHRLAPPNQRSKARWLNVDVLTDWAVKCLNGADQCQYTLPRQLQWLYEYRDEITLWDQYTKIARATRDLVRKHGYGRRVGEMLEKRLIKMNTSNQLVEDFACELIDFVHQECAQIKTPIRLIGTTEIIESAIGWFKSLMGETHWSQTGLGRLRLGLAGRLGGIDMSTVEHSLCTVKTSDIDCWLASSNAA